MIERFNGVEGARRLVVELCSQTSVFGGEQLAEAIAKVAELSELTEGDVLIEQGGEDSDVFFVITGSLAIMVNGRQVGERNPGTHVGEMALIDSKAVRSATVVALTKSVVAKVSESELSLIHI